MAVEQVPGGPQSITSTCLVLPRPKPKPCPWPQGEHGQRREGFGVKSWAEQMRKELQTTTTGAVMEASTSRQQAGSVAHFSGQASQPEELLEQCPIDLSSGTNFHVKKRT